MENKVTFERLDYLRLKDIAPVWSKLLEKRKFPFPFSLAWLKWYFLLDSPRNCIVGEAYNHFSFYQKNCEQCDELGWKFGHAFLVRSLAEMEKTVDMFEHHWNERHIFNTI